MIFGRLKTYLIAGLSALVGVLALVATVFGRSAKKQKKRADKAQAQATKQRIVMEKDVEITEQTRSRRADALKELEDTGESDVFNDPNKLRDRSRD